MGELIPISFALTPRLQSLIELRDALRCLYHANHNNSVYAWLLAAKELNDLLVGEGHKKPATPNILSLFHSMRKHLNGLSEKHPEFTNQLQHACQQIDAHTQNIQHQLPAIADYLAQDGWLNAYADATRKMDFLGHKLGIPQTFPILWLSNHEQARQLQTLVEPLTQAIEHINQMLHSHVAWDYRTAEYGCDQILLNPQEEIGMLIIGIKASDLQQGIVPDCTGFRSTIRLRFSQWTPGERVKDCTHNQDYALMMVSTL